MYTEQMYENSLCHYGIKGQKWGDRRFQNLDGTYTPLGERRRLETLARTGTAVTSSSALSNRQQQARTGNVVRVNSVNKTTTSKPLSRTVTTTPGASKVVLNKATGTVSRLPIATTVSKPTAKIVTSAESQKAKKKLAKASTETTDEEETTTTTKKKSSSNKKKSAKKKTQEEEKKDETQNEGPLSEEQVQDYARRVIRGEFGNGQERRDKLGDKYAQVQALVNALLLKGRKK